MDVQQLVSEFLASEHGNQATQALAAQGISGDDAQQMLSQAAEAAHSSADEQSGGLMGEHSGKSFLAGFAAGLVRGDGFFKSLEDGGAGMLSGRVAEALASRMGIDPSTASTVAAAATPYILAFMKEKFA
ncbi:hypothetical protein PHO31112_03234 [Pandoraea horticolens]|uniref:DUF937 domain-containing protein n=1 Tax=Pandoraea horticolens TaxID=2508298 RepID=A0A5E4WHH9_9BURK|nr:hypothetical protein [Pandoraea horticolens]VVE23054.1 hypothetical protein PHO31112_03234 [Pandoraea horticolens]